MLAGEVIAYEPPHVVACRDSAALIVATVRCTLEAVAGGTHVRVMVETAPGAPTPLSATVMRSVQHGLDALETWLEAGIAPAGLRAGNTA